MVTPTISQMTTPYPDKGQTQVVFDTNVDGLMSLFDALTTELPVALDWMQARVAEVSATALAGDLPDMTGNAGSFIRLNVGETAGEFRTPAQVVTDLGSGTTGRAVFESETDEEAQAVMGLGSNSVLDFADLVNTEAEWMAGTASAYAYITPAHLASAIGALGLLAVIEDQKSSGVASASMTGGTWSVRDLNTVTRNSNTAVAIAANEFTMARDGWCEWMCKHTDTFNSRLYNVTDGVVVAGGSGSSNGSLYNGITEGGALVVAGKTYRIELNASVTRALPGAARGVNEVYTRVRIFSA